ncbi:MAG: RagB/SusD family nutrient uptake outer membrane protein [Mangrovibacterium sp.]|nr:RagB/SusD family nutrient uptake outer membrane protein [Mangrovibacterium sp.]
MKLKINKIILILLSVWCVPIVSCKDYLDVVPDNLATIDHAFASRYEAEGFLFGCFSFIPSHCDINANPALTGGDEVWLIDNIYQVGKPELLGIAKGEQGTNAPLANYWSSQHAGSTRGGKALFTGIRDCNIFLEQIHKPADLPEWERRQWVAEVKFVKAYLYFWLFRMYGPLPLMEENLPISASPDEVQAYREPVDEMVNFIVGLLDEAVKNLPMQIMDMNIDMGRPTKPAALALKAQVLTFAASPLFNGNSDYSDITDNRGTHLFPQEYKAEKWQRAAEALKAAIDTCHSAGHALYDFHTDPMSTILNDSTVMSMQVRGAVTARWNSEIIWSDPASDPYVLQRLCLPGFFPAHASGGLLASYAPPMRIVEQFYSRNGVPIEEDPEWVNVDKYGLSQGDRNHRYYIPQGYTTMNLHFNREARFYGSISFDGGYYYGNGRITNDNALLPVELMYGSAPVFSLDRHSSTGYLVKKLLHYMTSVPDNSAALSAYRYAFPLIRLADLYLMYAEALNEWKPAPDAEVYQYIDEVRARTGLKGVVESWENHSTTPEKPQTKEGMREIIHRERLNELAFEGPRFWDLRRWKKAEAYMNQPIRGLNIYGETAPEFYKVENVFNSSFGKKDYLWPIKQSDLLENKNLVQNPGW